MIQPLQQHIDPDVPGTWYIITDRQKGKSYAMGAPVGSACSMKSIYQKLIQWLKAKKANEIDKLTVATFENWKLSEIFNEAVPCETYTAAELLFHPEQADPRYVAEHYVAFQRYCEQQGYTEPAFSAATYRLAQAYLLDTQPDQMYLFYNTAEGFITDIPDFSEYQLILPNTSQFSGLDLTRPVLNMQTASSQVIARTFSDNRPGCYLADYLFMLEWAKFHQSSQPTLWVKQQLIMGTIDFLLATHQKEWLQFLSDRELSDFDKARRSETYQLVCAKVGQPIAPTPDSTIRQANKKQSNNLGCRRL